MKWELDEVELDESEKKRSGKGRSGIERSGVDEVGMDEVQLDKVGVGKVELDVVGVDEVAIGRSGNWTKYDLTKLEWTNWFLDEVGVDGVVVIDIDYNKRLDRRRPCFEDELTAGSNL